MLVSPQLLVEPRFSLLLLMPYLYVKITRNDGTLSLVVGASSYALMHLQEQFPRIFRSHLLLSVQDQVISLTQQPQAEIAPPLPFRRRHRVLLMLVAILAVATFFRFYGREFDQHTNQHPDERAVIDYSLNIRWPASLSNLLDRHTSTLNLRRDQIGGCTDPNGCTYPYGALPIYLDRITGWALDTVLPPSDTQPHGYWLDNYTAVQGIGRSWSSVFDLLTILLIFLIARRLYSSTTGLIAAALYACAATAIQIAHFYVVDSVLVAFMMAALYFSVRMMQNPSWLAAAGAGACIGLAIATKVSVVPFAVVVVAAVILRAAYRKKTRLLGAEFGDPVGLRASTKHEREMSFGRHLLGGVGYLLLAGLVSVIGFGVAEPYVLWSFDFSALSRGFQAFAESNPWWQRIASETGVQSGQQDVPYTRQYVGTTPVLYPLQQWVFWGISVLPGTITMIGFAVGVWRALRRKPAEILLLAGALPYFATIAPLLAKWMRYTLPLVPIFCMLGAAFLVRGAIWASRRFQLRASMQPGVARLVRAQRAVFPILTALAVGSAFLWAVAFMNIYSQPHSRVQASAWYYDNIPDGARLTREGWDDILPVGLPSLADGKPRDGGARGYSISDFNLYDYQAPEQELAYITGMLKNVDYVSIASNRLYSSIPRMPWAYPVQTKYYELLYAGKLGFVLDHTIQVSPQLFGFNFNDQSADESFTVYDHPRVDLFKKVSDLTDDQFRNLFSTALNRPEMFTAGTKGTVFDDKGIAYSQPVDTLPQLDDYAWNPLAQPDTQWIGVLLWLLAVYVLGFLALPIVFTVCRNLPDRGYALAKLAALLIVSWGMWMAASAHLIPFTVWGLLLMIALMAGLSAVCWRFGAGARIRDFMRTKGRLVMAYEAVFLLAFAAMLVLRMLNPDLWHTIQGGEKPMETGFLNSVLRSPWAPPLDPGFAGGFINYYYYGYFVVGCLVKLVGVYPAIAFNLAVPLLYALTFTIAVSLVYNVVAWSRQRRGSTSAVSRTALAFGLLGGVLMLAIGNLHGFLQWVMITFPSAGQGMLDISQRLHLVEQSLHTPYTAFNWWDATRVVGGTINEFPYWTFLFADLHPHLIDMPFTIMTAVLILNLVFTGGFRRSANLWLRSGDTSLRHKVWQRVTATLAWLWGPGWTGALTFGLMSLALGALAVINSWDFPTYMGIAGGGVLVALLLVGRHGETADELAEGAEPAETALNRIGALDRAVLYAAGLLSVALLAVAALASYLPFFLNFKTLYTSIFPLVDGSPVEGIAGSDIMHRTVLAEFLIVWGLFVFVALSYLVYRLWNFPWTAALNDLMSRFQLAPRAPRTGTVPQHAFEAHRPTEALRRRAFSLSGAGASGGGGASLAIPQTLFYRSGGGNNVESVEAGEESSLHDGNGSHTLVTRPAHAGTNSAPVEELASWLASTERPVPTQDGEAEGLVQEGVAHNGHRDHTPPPTNGWLSTTYPDDTLNTLDEGEAYRDNGDGASAWLPDLDTIQVNRQAQPPAILVAPAVSQPGAIPLWAGLAILGVTAALVMLQIVTGQLLLALLVALIGGIAATTLSTSRSAANMFCGLLLVGGLFVAMGVELVYLADHLHLSSMYRMNTVFKFYVQVWVLLAAGSAAAIYYMIYGLRQRAITRRAAATVETMIAEAPQRTERNSHGADGMLVSGAAEEWQDSYSSITVEDIDAYTDTKPLQASSPRENGAADLSEPGNWLVWSLEHSGSGRSEATLGDAPPAGTPTTLPLRVAHASTTSPEAKLSVRQSSDLERGAESQAQARPRWTVGRLAWLGVFALFVAASLVFTILGTPDRLRQRIAPSPPIGTLNGLDFLKTAQITAMYDANAPAVPVDLKYDYDAITWINKNVQGAKVMAELPVEYYRAFGERGANETGLSMVVGGLHQDEQRYSWLVGDRRKDMNDFFSTQDVQLALTIISKYNIDYIYLGQLEQAQAGEGVRKFQQLADPKVHVLEKVFESQGPAGIKGTTIYKVMQQPGREVSTLLGVPVAGSGVPGISITPLPTAPPTPMPTPPVDDPELKALIAAAAQKPGDHEARQRLIDWYTGHGYPAEAARELEGVVEQDPHNVAARHQLGDAYQAAGQPDKALKAWEDARDVEPNAPAVHNKVGIAYLERKRYDDAVNEFTTAVQKDPGFTESDYHLGEAYQLKGDKASAITAYQSVIDHAKPDDGWAVEARKKLAQLK